MAIYGLGGRPDYVEVVRVAESVVWPGPSTSFTVDAGVPSGDLDVEFYFDSDDADALYRWNGSTWDGPLAYTYSAVTPGSGDVTGPDYWVASVEGLGDNGVFGPRVVTPAIPADGTLVVWDETSGAWVAASPANAVGAFVAGEVTALIDGAPGALDTLNELAAALNDDANFATTVTNALAGKADTSHNHDGTYAAASHNHDSAYAAASHNHDSAYAPKTQSINTQTGVAYTLVLGDENKAVTLSNGSAIDLTVPTEASVAFPVGARVDLVQLGDGQVTVGGAGVTIRSSGTLKLRAKYSGASLLKIATDEWVLVGDVEV